MFKKRLTEEEIAEIKLNMRSIINDPMKVWSNGGLILVHRFPKLTELISWNAAAIRWATDSFWNHTAMSVIVNGKPYVMESNMKGVVLEPLSYWLENYGDKIWTYHKAELDISYDDIEKFIGKKYDYFSVYLAHPIYILSKKLNLSKDGFWIGKTGIDASDKTYCTEIFSHLWFEKTKNDQLSTPEKLTSADLAKMDLSFMKK